MGIYSVDKLMAETRRLAAEYRRATGQPLPVTAEIAKYDAARLLDLEVIQQQNGGFDAVGRSGENRDRRFQVKGRAIFDEVKGGHRVGQLKLEQDWDSVLLVLMDKDLEPYEIWEADRPTIEQAMQQGKRSRKGAMTVAKFQAIGNCVWSAGEDSAGGGDQDEQGSD